VAAISELRAQIFAKDGQVRISSTWPLNSQIRKFGSDSDFVTEHVPVTAREKESVFGLT
jgi:hypothetical protein